MDDRDSEPEAIPLVAQAYIERVRQLIARFAAQIARDGGSYYDRQCLKGWQRELERLKRGEVY